MSFLPVPILSMLHERAAENSATRLFLSAPVIRQTLDRLLGVKLTEMPRILCWDDQVAAVKAATAGQAVTIVEHGLRQTLPNLEALTVAQRWSDGWRGGLAASTAFDVGFHAQAVAAVLKDEAAEAVLLIDPAAGMVDAELLGRLVRHAAAQSAVEFCFIQAPPGLCAATVRRSLVERLAATRQHPGRLLNYHPDAPARDPIGGDGTLPVSQVVARAQGSFLLNSVWQVNRFERILARCGSPEEVSAERLINLAGGEPMGDGFPRDVVLELTTQRRTRALYAANTRHRSLLIDSDIQHVIDAAHVRDDARVTVGGIGDPLLHQDWQSMIRKLISAGASVHLETDLLPDDPNAIEQLAICGLDVISVNLPAFTSPTYATVMGVDRYPEAVDNIRRLVLARHNAGRGVPLIVPTFTKCRQNVHEMEGWYDQWLRALGSAVIKSPPNASSEITVADMRPAKRVPCRRVGQSLTILSDGNVCGCDVDVHGQQLVGSTQAPSLASDWREGVRRIRSADPSGSFDQLPACAGCREWHRS